MVSWEQSPFLARLEFNACVWWVWFVFLERDHRITGIGMDLKRSSSPNICAYMNVARNIINVLPVLPPLLVLCICLICSGKTKQSPFQIQHCIIALAQPACELEPSLQSVWFWLVPIFAKNGGREEVWKKKSKENRRKVIGFCDFTSHICWEQESLTGFYTSDMQHRLLLPGQDCRARKVLGFQFLF